MPGLLVVSVLAAYIPTILGLIDGPWQTEQEGHGPLIIAASLWLVWQSREKLKTALISPAPVAGWAVLTMGLVLMFLARLQQGLLTFEMFSLIPVIVGCILLSAGWPMLRILAFPIFFLLFAVPMPDWIIDAATVPLKVFISNVVTQVLYAAGFPVAQNGVMIMIGSYQLLVKDACSGMNSIFALVCDRGVLCLCFSLGRESSQLNSAAFDHSDYDPGELHSRACAGSDSLLWRA